MTFPSPPRAPLASKPLASLWGGFAPITMRRAHQSAMQLPQKGDKEGYFVRFYNGWCVGCAPRGTT